MEQLREEQWFYLYNFQMPPWETNRLVIIERKWFIDRFIKQKDREKEAYDREKAKVKKK